MLFSVIIPTFNRFELLRDTLQSVYAQSFTDFEIIVVDDGSTDGTAEHLGLQEARIRFIRQDSFGPGAARNAGAAIAKGQYLAFLDSDDLWFPWTLEAYFRAISEHGTPSFIAGKPFYFKERRLLDCAHEEPMSSRLFPDYLASGDEWRWWGVSSFVIRTDIFRAVGGFTSAKINGEDADLALKLGVAPGFIQVTSPCTFAYREHETNITKDLDRTLEGAWHKIRSECSASYPGGGLRRRERWRILTRHIRPCAIQCVRLGRYNDGWKLYCSTFYWNLALGRWKFLMGFPFKAVPGCSWNPLWLQ